MVGDTARSMFSLPKGDGNSCFVHKEESWGLKQGNDLPLPPDNGVVCQTSQFSYNRYENHPGRTAGRKDGMPACILYGMARGGREPCARCAAGKEKSLYVHKELWDGHDTG